MKTTLKLNNKEEYQIKEKNYYYNKKKNWKILLKELIKK